MGDPQKENGRIPHPIVKIEWSEYGHDPVRRPRRPGGPPIRDAMAGVTYWVRMYHKTGYPPTPGPGGTPSPLHAGLTNAPSGAMIGNPEPKGGGREDLRP